MASLALLDNIETSGIQPVQRKYEIKYYGGTIQIDATSTRDAIEQFEKKYTDNWHTAGLSEPELKSILPAGPENAIDKANYNRIIAFEKKHEEPMRKQMIMDFLSLLKPVNK